jgi:hypothetical protein
MSDIVERLGQRLDLKSEGWVIIDPDPRGDLREAAAEIKRLRAALSNAIDVQLKLQAEIEGLRHDIDRCLAAANSEATEVERLRAALRQIAEIPEQFGVGPWIDIAEAALNAALYSPRQEPLP